jgi:hypothetical protein
MSCEHTCSGRSKIQLRAMDPSKYLAEIWMDGTDGRAVRDIAQRPLPEGELQSHTWLPMSRPAVHIKALRSMYRHSRFQTRPLSRGRMYVHMYPTLASRKPMYKVHNTTCTRDWHYAEVSFNITMY